MSKVYIGYIEKELISSGYITAGGEYTPLTDSDYIRTPSKGETTIANVQALALKGHTTREISALLKKDRSRVDEILRDLRRQHLI